MKENLLVSIIINNYNYERFIHEAIESSLRQSYSYKEIIIVDDGSTDNSRQVIESYSGQVVPIFKENGGQSSALNAGFLASKGDIICFLDADDIYLEQKIEIIASLFVQRPDVLWCFHALKLFNTFTNSYYQTFLNFETLEINYSSILKNGQKIPLSFIPTATSGLCFRREVLEKIFPIPDSILIASDNYLKYYSIALYKGIFLSQALSIQKIHGDNLYTLRIDKQTIKIKTLLLTAYWLRVNIPSVYRFSNGFFVLGIARYWFFHNNQPECKKIVQNYFSLIGITEFFWILPRAFFCYMKIIFMSKKNYNVL